MLFYNPVNPGFYHRATAQLKLALRLRKFTQPQLSLQRLQPMLPFYPNVAFFPRFASFSEHKRARLIVHASCPFLFLFVQTRIVVLRVLSSAFTLCLICCPVCVFLQTAKPKRKSVFSCFQVWFLSYIIILPL